MIFRIFYCTAIVLILFASCSTDEPRDDIERIVIRLQQEPARLNPILQLSSYETDLSEYVFISMGDYDPVTMKMMPVMIQSLPTAKMIDEGPHTGGVSYSMEIVPEAVWGNGEPITGRDVEFTFKAVNHPGVDTRGWKALMNDVIAVEQNPENPRQFSVITSGNYFLNLEAILSAEIYPSYFYDPQGLLEDISLSQLKSPGFADSLQARDAQFASFGETFSSIDFSKRTVQGAGPYRLSQWETGQYIILEKKENYWGDAYPDRSYLRANPQQIIFQILEDDATAVTQLKNGELDVISLSAAPHQVFDDLKNDQSSQGRYQFFTPDVLRFYYVAMNNDDPRLADVAVRKALNHLADVNQMIRQIEGGYARRINSIIHPSKQAYNDQLPDVDFNPQKAMALLEEAGWSDSNNDGTRDKRIDGKTYELDLRFFITGSNLSQSISTMLQEEASKAGISIDIINKEWRNTRSENLQTGDFEMTTLSVRQSPAPSDPFVYWHSEAIGLGGLNYSRYSNARADRLMEEIRTTLDEDRRLEAYRELQEVFYNDSPAILLYAPVERYVISSAFDPLISSKKPGYFANAFRLK